MPGLKKHKLIFLRFFDWSVLSTSHSLFYAETWKIHIDFKLCYYYTKTLLKVSRSNLVTCLYIKHRYLYDVWFGVILKK